MDEPGPQLIRNTELQHSLLIITKRFCGTKFLLIETAGSAAMWEGPTGRDCRDEFVSSAFFPSFLLHLHLLLYPSKKCM